MSRWTQRYDELLDETVYQYTHESGLDIIALKKEGFTKKYGFFGTQYGSFHQCFTWKGERMCMPSGIAHFLEHKIFEDSEQNLFDRFAAYGANVNAYTSYNSTVYHFGTVDHFGLGMSDLMKFVQRVELTDENVEKEKGIIVQELKSYEDETEYQTYFKMVGGLFAKHPIRQDVGGTESDVLSITKEQLMNCYEAFYAPRNMVVFVAGDFDLDEMLDIILGQLTEAFLSRQGGIADEIPCDLDPVVNGYHEFEAEIQMPFFSLGFKGATDFETKEDLIKTSLSARIFFDAHFGKGTDYFDSLYKANLLNSTFSLDFSYGDHYSFVSFDGETSQPQQVAESIEKELLRIIEEGVDEVAFERIKKKMIGRLVSTGNSVQYTANSFVNNYMKGIHMFDITKNISEVTSEYAIHYLKEAILPSRRMLVVAKPFNKGQEA